MLSGRRQRPWDAMVDEPPCRHAAEHEQAGNTEIEKSQHADGQRQRDADHRVDRAQHEPIDDLLREDGAPRDP